MNILDYILPSRVREKEQVKSYWQALNAYTPVFSTRSGGIYEALLTRRAIDAKATAYAKLSPQVLGSYTTLDAALKSKPNPYQTTYAFLYRLGTILEVETNAIILPYLAGDYETVIGFYTIYPSSASIVTSSDGELYLRFQMQDGQTAALEIDKVGILTKFQCKDDFFGSGNSPINSTLDVIHAQDEGMIEGIKAGAATRLMVKIGGNVKPDDLKKEKERFIRDNIEANRSGVVFADNKYDEVKQLITKPYLIDSSQQKIIQESVSSYFGVSEAILQNKYSEDDYNAFYEGVVEPFAIQLSQVLTNMTFNASERRSGAQIVFSDNRLQYASMKTKITYAQVMFDRGLASANDIADIFSQPHIEGGDVRYIRKEYTTIGANNAETEA